MKGKKSRRKGKGKKIETRNEVLRFAVLEYIGPFIRILCLCQIPDDSPVVEGWQSHHQVRGGEVEHRSHHQMIIVG